MVYGVTIHNAIYMQNNTTNWKYEVHETITKFLYDFTVIRPNDIASAQRNNILPSL